MFVPIFLAVRTRGWTKVVDSTRAIGPYAHKGNQWYSYDDPFSVTHKAEFIRSSGYGGAMVWDLSLDDHLNLCCREPMPLLRSINRVLRTVSYSEPRPGGGNCGQASKPPTPPPPKRTTTYASGKLFLYSCHLLTHHATRSDQRGRDTPHCRLGYRTNKTTTQYTTKK